MITFSEFIRQKGIYISTHNRDTDIYKDYDVNILLQEYNEYITEQPITSEFLLGLGFEDYYSGYRIFNDKYEIDISVVNNECIFNCYLTNDTIKIPFPKTQKDVLDLIRLLELN